MKKSREELTAEITEHLRFKSPWQLNEILGFILGIERGVRERYVREHSRNGRQVHGAYPEDT